MQTVGLDLADERDHEELIAHGGHEVIVARSGQGGGVRGVIVAEHIVDGVREGVPDPVVGFVLVDEEFWQRAGGMGGRRAVGFDDGKDDSHADQQR